RAVAADPKQRAAARRRALHARSRDDGAEARVQRDGSGVSRGALRELRRHVPVGRAVRARGVRRHDAGVPAGLSTAAAFGAGMAGAGARSVKGATMLRENRIARQATVFTAVAALAAGCTREMEPACDRACLLDVAERYLAAIAAGEPGLAPLS